MGEEGAQGWARWLAAKGAVPAVVPYTSTGTVSVDKIGFVRLLSEA